MARRNEARSPDKSPRNLNTGSQPEARRRQPAIGTGIDPAQTQAMIEQREVAPMA